MAPVATRVNFKPVNRRALRQYGVFWQAIQAVDAAVGDAEKLAAQARDRGDAVENRRTAIPTAEELQAAAKKAGRALQIIASASKKWEAELISREWRR
jgi:hypothetical protein